MTFSKELRELVKKSFESTEGRYLIWRHSSKRLVQGLIRSLVEELGGELVLEDPDPEVLLSNCLDADDLFEGCYRFRINGVEGDLAIDWQCLYPETAASVQEQLDRFVVRMELAAQGSPIADDLPSALNRILLPRFGDRVS